MEGNIAIIGGGISGLSTAYTLVEKGYKVKVIARAFTPETTSDKAAAFWFPYHIQSDQRCVRWCKTSYDKYTALMADTATGISMQRLLKVTKESGDKADMLWRSFMPEGAYEALAEKELKKGFATGFAVHVPLVEMHVFLPWLMEHLHRKGVEFMEHEVTDLAASSGKYKWVINCTGLGARELCQDNSIYPVRGQIAITVPHQGLPIFLYEEQPFYIVPRRDATIIGGTYEENVWETTPEPDTIQRLYRQAVELYPQLGEVGVTGSWAGLRPYRPEIRVEKEMGTNIIHNYGHGGSGFTLAWGCAEDILSMVGAL